LPSAEPLALDGLARVERLSSAANTQRATDDMRAR
jgi:hypothetical protein